MSSSYAPLPLKILGSRAEPRPSPFLLEAHCSGSELVENTVPDQIPGATLSFSTLTALELAKLINEPGEIINASFPRVSALLTDAERSMAEKRIDDLYSQLQQVSGIFQELISDLISNTELQATEIATAAEISEPEHFPPDTPIEAIPEIDSTVEPGPQRAMAAAA